MNLDSISQLVSLVSLGTLAYITFLLSRKNRIHQFITVGQDVFSWLTGVLLAIFITRICVFFHLFSQTTSRTVNSIMFLTAVIGIFWSVTRHGKQQ